MLTAGTRAVHAPSQDLHDLHIAAVHLHHIAHHLVHQGAGQRGDMGNGLPGGVRLVLAHDAPALAPSVLATDIAGPLLVDVILTLPGLLIAARLE